MNLLKIDRRVIYFVVMASIGLPLILGVSIPPAQMKAAEKFYDLVESLDPESGKIAFVALDYGPNTKAENQPQSEVIIEHLMRRRIPVAVLTQYALAEGFLATIPQDVADRLMEEHPGEIWQYGKDWVNLGYRPGSSVFVQNIAKAEDLAAQLEKDTYGTPLSQIEMFQEVKTIRDIQFLAEFTGLVGMFDLYVRFFQTKGYVPKFGHGCTSITIPEAYIYLDSGQIGGLLEGIAGAAWYSELLTRNFPDRTADVDGSLVANTALGVAHLVIIAFIIIGNILMFIGRKEER